MEADGTYGVGSEITIDVRWGLCTAQYRITSQGRGYQRRILVALDASDTSRLHLNDEL